jgi:hypothetical protein
VLHQSAAHVVGTIPTIRAGCTATQPAGNAQICAISLRTSFSAAAQLPPQHRSEPGHRRLHNTPFGGATAAGQADSWACDAQAEGSMC